MRGIAPSLLVPILSCSAGLSAPASMPASLSVSATVLVPAPATASMPPPSRSTQNSGETSADPKPFATRCNQDLDCGYDPSTDSCGSDPRFNRQPPIVDQGILCYCDAHREACALFRVLPTPCEGDFSCAVHLDPRPHPARATKAAPHERGKPCRDYKLATSCERTNICTLRALPCEAR